MRDLVRRQTDFLEMAGKPLPDRGPLFSLAQVQLRDCFLRFLQTDRVSVLVVVLDDLFLVTAALRRHVGGSALGSEGTETGNPDYRLWVPYSIVMVPMFTPANIRTGIIRTGILCLAQNQSAAENSTAGVGGAYRDSIGSFFQHTVSQE